MCASSWIFTSLPMVLLLLPAYQSDFANASALKAFVPPLLEQSFGRAMLRNSEAIKRNPGRSMECLSDFNLKLKASTKKLEDAQAVCEKRSEEARAMVPLQVANQRTNLTNTVAITCNKFADCSDNKQALDFFRCYECTASEAINVAHWLGLNSREGAKLVEISYDVIAYDRQRCTNGASTAFLNDNTKLQDDLDACISGGHRCNGKPRALTDNDLDKLKLEAKRH